MKKLFQMLNLLFVVNIFAQTTPSATENYVYSKTYLSEDGTKTAEAIQYFDGLGRAKQSIAIKATTSGKDIVTPTYYDDLGRQTKDYLPLPMATSNGALQQNVSEAAINNYYGVANAYAEKLLENSPIAKVLEIASPGNTWAMNSGHTQKVRTETNVTSDAVKKYSITSSWANATISFSIPTVSFYADNQLIKNIAIDENGNQTIEFKNTKGQTILVRKINNGSNVDTYYIYNEFGIQVLVIPPKANDQITNSGNIVTQAILDKLCYQYKYDNKGRLVEKRIPGKKFWEFLVYDKQNRLVLSQDANQNGTKWSFVKYDKFDRIVYTGIYNSTSNRVTLQNSINTATNAMNNEDRSATSFTANTLAIYYTNVAFPTGANTILSVNYYDTYPTGTPTKPTAILTQNTLNTTATSYTVNGVTSTRSTKGMPTSTYTKNIDTDTWTKSFIWYDTTARPVGTHTINYLGGYTKTETQLDFAGVILKSNLYHKRLTTSSEVVIKERYEYDAQNRLKKRYHQVNANTEILLTENTYNDLGQIINKKVGDNLQSIDYSYNIRGWLTAINDVNNMGTKLFAYKIKYDQRDGAQNPNTTYSSLSVTPQYNGNITEIDWKTAGAQSDGKTRRYGFVYDNLNRMRAGFYQDPNNAYTREYSEYLEYDQNGNITKLNRTGKMTGSTTEVMDDLTYNYTNADNQLTSITESGSGNNLSGYPLSAGTGTIMQYDNNGNITTQADKGITNIAYNLLNLPSVITTNNNQNASYFYRADGTKVKKVANGNTTDYLDGFQYVNGALQFFATAEGYYDVANARYVYNYTDHLGNVRISFTKNTSGTAVVLEENNYYPFGLKHNGYNTGSIANTNYAYKYNGKELQENGQYDYGARFYMADLARWGTVDPLAESYRRWSPYNYAVDNPIRYIDPDGRGTQVSWAQSQMGWETNEEWDARNGGAFSSSFYKSIDAGGSTGGDGNKLTGLINLIVYIINDLPINNNMYDEANNWDYIFVKNIDDVQRILEDTYGNDIPNYKNLIIKSHALLFSGPLLKDGNGLNESTVPDASKNSGLRFLANHLSPKSNILFTGCNFAMGYTDKNNTNTKPIVDSYLSLFLKEERTIMFNVATSTSSNIFYQNKKPISESFIFNQNLIPKTGKEYAGFMIFGLDSKGNITFDKNYYNISVQSNGGFIMTPMMLINNTKIHYENAKSFWKK